MYIFVHFMSENKLWKNNEAVILWTLLPFVICSAYFLRSSFYYTPSRQICTTFFFTFLCTLFILLSFTTPVASKHPSQGQHTRALAFFPSTTIMWNQLPMYLPHQGQPPRGWVKIQSVYVSTLYQILFLNPRGL